MPPDTVHIRAGERPGTDRRMRMATMRRRVEHGPSARTLCGAPAAPADVGPDTFRMWLPLRGRADHACAWLSAVCPYCEARLRAAV